MQSKNEKVVSTGAKIHQYAWSTANLTAVSLGIGTGIVVINSPLRAFILNSTKTGNLMPVHTGGFLGLGRVLYKGFTANLLGSNVRSFYISETKSNKPVDDEVKGEKLSPQAQLGYVAAAALGEIAVTQIPETKGQLISVGILPKEFKVRSTHNAVKLLTNGITPRFVGGTMNFACICLMEEQISNKLSIRDPKLKHFVAGATTGLFSAAITFPVALFKDHTLVKTAVTLDGQLKNKSSISAMKDIVQTVRNNPRHALGFFAHQAKTQLPVRAASTALIMAIVSTVTEAMGPEPLKNVAPKRWQPPRVIDSPAAAEEPVITEHDNKPGMK